MNFATEINHDDLTRALRVQLGWEADEEEDGVRIGAFARVDGLHALQFTQGAAASGKSAVILSVGEVWRPDAWPSLTIFQPAEGSLIMKSGLTLWAADGSSPLLIVGRGEAHPAGIRVGRDGLEDLGRVLLRIDRSAQEGITRATARLRRSAGMMAGLRRMASTAA